MEQPDYEKVNNRLTFLSNLYGGLIVQRFIDFPRNWIDYSKTEEFNNYVQTYGFPNHREITKYEIVIDVDSDTYEDGVKHADLIEARLRKKGYYFTRYYSGGTGQHIHLHFKRRMINELLKKYFLGEIRRNIIAYIVGEDLIHPKDIASHVCLYDKKLIQIEWMLHRKGKIKTKVSTFGGMSLQNDVPQAVYNRLERQRKENAERAERIKEKLKTQKLPEMNCIRYILGETINEMTYSKEEQGFYRSMFLLCAHYMRKGMEKKDIIEKIYEWYDSQPKTMKDKCLRTVNKGIIKYTIMRTNGTAGCNYAMKMLEDIQATKICANCPYY